MLKHRTAFVLLFLISAVAHADVPVTRQQELLYLLRHDCGSCHGMTLQGGLGPPLTPEALAEKSPDWLRAVILDGRDGTAMPPWRPFLSENEATWLVDLLMRGTNHAD